MPSLIITLQSPYLSSPLDLELPGTVPLNQLLPDVVRVLAAKHSLPSGDYQLMYDDRVLPEDQTLFEAQARTGHVLALMPTQELLSRVSAAAHSGQGLTNAALTTSSGRKIVLNNFTKDELRIGRHVSQTGQLLDIDLADEPGGDTVSRSHAKLYLEGGQWIIEPLETTNPTRIGGQKLNPGATYPLRSGDVLYIGKVKLMFEQGR